MTASAMPLHCTTTEMLAQNNNGEKNAEYKFGVTKHRHAHRTQKMDASEEGYQAESYGNPRTN